DMYDSEGFHGTITIDAAAGERDITFFLLGTHLDDGEVVYDDTATGIIFNELTGVDWLNGAGVNDFNLSFASAETIRFYQTSGMSIKWYIPEVTTIDLSPTYHSN